jgi:hypothetical protein
VIAVREGRVEIEWLGASGQRLREPVQVGTAFSVPNVRIASDGREFVALWRTREHELASVRIGSDGVAGPVQTLPRILATPNRQIWGLVWSGTEYVALTSETIGTRFISDWALVSTSISVEGVVHAPRVVLRAGSSTPTYSFSGAALASNGREVLYVWTWLGKTFTKLGIDGVESELLSDPAGIASAVWDGQEFVYVFSAYESRFLLRGDARVDLPRESIVLAAQPSMRTAVVYSRWVERIPGFRGLGAARGFVRFVLLAAKRRAVRF